MQRSVIFDDFLTENKFKTAFRKSEPSVKKEQKNLEIAMIFVKYSRNVDFHSQYKCFSIW